MVEHYFDYYSIFKGVSLVGNFTFSTIQNGSGIILKIREIQPSYKNKEMFSRFGGAEKSSSSEIGSELKEIGRTPPTDSLECFSQRGTDDGEVGRQRQPQQPLFHGGI